MQSRISVKLTAAAEWLPAILSDERAESSYGLPVVIVDGEDFARGTGEVAAVRVSSAVDPELIDAARRAGFRVEEGQPMNEQQFQSEMRRAETMRRLAADPTQADYYADYIRGLRRAHHGERFGSQQEHELWLSLASDVDDESRAGRGRGYRDGLAFSKERQLST